MSNPIEKLLQEAIRSISPDIPAAVFHFDFDRNAAESFLKEHLGVPFIIRKSSVDEFYALDTYNWETGVFGHLLIESPQEDCPEFKLYHNSQGVNEEYGELTHYAQIRWERVQNKIAWQKFKEKLDRIPEQNRAVLSIQSLDKKKVAVTAEQLDEFARNNPGLQYRGDGHTGFAMAKALHAPFAVIRSEGKREEINSVLKGRVSDNTMLVITGHGSPHSEGIEGSYVNLDDLKGVETAFNQQIERGPGELVSSILEAGLQKGNHIILLLCICYAAVDAQGTDNSFAHRLAREFAAQGISSTIIASDKPVKRFGYEAIEDEALTFDDAIGMAPADVCVFTTEVDGPDTNPDISIYKPNECIVLSQTGLRFLNLYNPLLNLQSLRINVPSSVGTPAVKKQAPEQPDLLMKIQKMKNYGKSLADLGIGKGNTAVELAEALENKLTHFLLETDLTEKNITQFKSSFSALLHSKDLIMHEHREQWKPIVANILIALTGIGLLAILFKVICHAIEVSNQNKPMSFNQSFFFAKPKTQEFEEEIEDSLNRADFTA
ncbi:hypothetical protein [Legionella shakespearei]|uniref:Ankyrin repeat protein n=1 Tax=Legionella shakespearei DSM 23087 TaxID=1122169 RepID=A0A0W0Z7Q2_9GAMM|nr:hypothetical protein [Legionella shakespearei]KTD64975.1 Ankyrin repeat protein [Legionella shakespearei DSM 23087]